MIGHIHGFVASDWIAAKRLLIERARHRASQLISYSDLVCQLPLSIEASDPRLSYLLDEISRDEYTEGRGFLTVLVVHKYGSRPGAGFYEMARGCGADFDDEEEFNIRAFNEVTGYWRRTTAQS
ncbi:hypothetical protein [Pseudomonas fluorescens]|uniref:Uncharacterized protein n=1 Tax=Pseudomonas fluorescens TaxID=294 RepID=A0A5E6VWC6_PSEFL|nr:hypothetical protein [Pseudomonas fluorescens]VVN18799.1 hypothetical protein PS652_04212 [Pseudomonas fluorescens]